MSTCSKTGWRLAGLAVACTVTTLSAASVYGQTPANLKAIAKAWHDRQEHVQSARLSWVEHETRAKGYLTDFLHRGESPEEAAKSMEQMGIPPGSVVPPQDTTYDVAASLSLDGEKMRHSREDRQWSAKEKAYVPEPRTVVFNGEVGKMLHLAHSSSYLPWPSGMIEGRNPEPSSVSLSPLVMTFRALEPATRLFDLESLRVTGGRAVIDGTSCVELQARSGAFVQRVWLDPSRDWVMVRLLSTVREQPQTKIDVRYRNDAEHGWVPDKWDISSFGPSGKVLESVRAKLTSYEINVPLEAEEFDIDFPPGTRVTDTRDPKQQLTYIVKEGAILPEILGKQNNVLLSWPFLLTAAIGAGAAVWLLWRKKLFRKNVI